MKYLVIISLAVFLFSCGPKDHINSTVSHASSDEEGFDSLLAQRLGADEYGMKNYVMALLKKGPHRDQTKEVADSIQRAHLDNITLMAEEGKLVVAGPFVDDSDVQGVYVFDVSTIEEAQVLTETDPAVQSGRLIMELHPFYCSAGLNEIPALHKKIAKKNH